MHQSDESPIPFVRLTTSRCHSADGSAQAKGYALPYPNFVAGLWRISATVAQSLTPYPQYTNIFNNFEGSGTTYYQALQIQVEKRFTNGLSFLAGYTLSRL